MQIHDEADFSDVVFRSQIADIVFIMVPRIHSVLIQVVIGDSKQGQTLIAVSLLESIIFKIMNNSCFCSDCNKMSGTFLVPHI